MLSRLVQVCCQPGKGGEVNGGEERDEKKREEERDRGERWLVAATGHVCDLELTYLCELQSK